MFKIMPNQELKNSTYKVPNNIMGHLSNNIRQFRGDKNSAGYKKVQRIVDTGELSYEQIKKFKSYFENNENKDEEYVLLGGEKMKMWVDKELGTSRDAISHVKKTRMDAGEENQFKQTHTKDKDNADPTRVRIPNISKSAKNRNIMTNKVVYENINDEMDSIKYLIEYMDNNKKIID